MVCGLIMAHRLMCVAAVHEVLTAAVPWPRRTAQARAAGSFSLFFLSFPSVSILFSNSFNSSSTSSAPRRQGRQPAHAGEQEQRGPRPDL